LIAVAQTGRFQRQEISLWNTTWDQPSGDRGQAPAEGCFLTGLEVAIGFEEDYDVAKGLFEGVNGQKEGSWLLTHCQHATLI
jgi:hypothetical protein